MPLLRKYGRPLALGLAAAALCAGVACAQSMPLNERITLCGTCHGDDGNSRIEKLPSLAGQPEFFLANQLVLMREGVRRSEAMAPFVKNLADPEIEMLAKHFAGLEPKPSGEPVDPSLVKRGAELSAALHCGSCHLPTLTGQQQMPRLAKQRVDYLIVSLKEFRDTTRPGGDTAMSANLAGTSDADLAALAHYCASF